MNRRLHHAAALAFVGWYLMVPPYSQGDFNEHAHLSDWKIINSFDTAKECRSHQLFVSERTQSDVPQHGDPPTTDKQRYAVSIALSACVASDDPRLKEK